MIETSPILCKHHRFPAEIIAHAVWLFCRIPFSFRDVEDLLAERGIEVSFQTVSEWAAKLGLKFVLQLRRRSRGQFADKWQLDEMVGTIKGKKYWLWRAVDANGYVLDALPQSRRNKRAAFRLMRKLLKAQGTTPRLMVTDKLMAIMPGGWNGPLLYAVEFKRMTRHRAEACIVLLLNSALHRDASSSAPVPSEWPR